MIEKSPLFFSSVLVVIVAVGLSVVATRAVRWHDSLQNPQLPWPPICSNSLSTFVEHQYLQLKRMHWQIFSIFDEKWLHFYIYRLSPDIQNPFLNFINIYSMRKNFVYSKRNVYTRNIQLYLLSIWICLIGTSI